MNRGPDKLLHDILLFLKSERDLYGDWNRLSGKPHRNEQKIQGSAGLQNNRTQSASASVKDFSSGERNDTIISDNSNSSDPVSGTGEVEKEKKKNISGQKGIKMTKEQDGAANKGDGNSTTTSTKSAAGTLDACKNLEELKAVCEAVEILKTDLSGTNLVFGMGNPEADLLLIGEAPGAKEDEQGVPFVGRSGKLLDKILEAIGFNRDDIYIANILKHRPPDNRNPTSEERQRSLPYLMKQIDIIKPRLILCLGKVSGTTMLGHEDSLKNLRGKFHPFKNSELMVTYHPAALLRNPNWKRPAWEDVQMLKKRYDKLGCKP